MPIMVSQFSYFYDKSPINCFDRVKACQTIHIKQRKNQKAYFKKTFYTLIVKSSGRLQRFNRGNGFINFRVARVFRVFATIIKRS